MAKINEKLCATILSEKELGVSWNVAAAQAQAAAQAVAQAQAQAVATSKIASANDIVASASNFDDGQRQADGRAESDVEYEYCRKLKNKQFYFPWLIFDHF